jgi:hypothetical protein
MYRKNTATFFRFQCYPLLSHQRTITKQKLRIDLGSVPDFLKISILLASTLMLRLWRSQNQVGMIQLEN